MSDQNSTNLEEQKVSTPTSPESGTGAVAFNVLRHVHVPFVPKEEPGGDGSSCGGPTDGDDSPVNTGKDKDPTHKDPTPTPLPKQQATVGRNVDHGLVGLQGDNGRIYQKNLHNSTTNFIGIDAGEQEQIRANTLSLKELTEALPFQGLDMPEFMASPVREKVGDYSYQLRQNSLLCISCSEPEISLSVARAVAEELGFESNEQKRLLNLRSHPVVASNLTIYSLAQRQSNFEQTTVIIVDTLSETARTLRDSLTAESVTDIPNLTAGLVRQQVLLICLVDVKPEEDGVRSVGAQAFVKKIPFWRLQLVRPLLEHQFPEKASQIEEKIKQQRDRYGYWGNEENTYFELKGLISRGTLPQTLAARDATLEYENVEDIFKTDDQVRATALYVATFLPNLNPREFQRMVVLLLGDKTIPITTKERKKNEKDEYEEIDVVHQKPLLEVWRERSDALMTECQLGAMVSREGGRTVRFSREKLRDELQTLIEDQYPFFLSEQLTQIERLGLLFDESVAIAKNTTKLLVDVLVEDPSHGKRWLVDTLSKLEEKYSEVETPGCIRSKREAYQRVADLIRQYLERTESASLIGDALEELIQTKRQWSVLEIVNRLRFAQHFDGFHWSKQLIERGGKVISDLTSFHLYIHLVNLGAKVYQSLVVLDTWIKKDSPLESTSRSGLDALRLVVIYCRITTNATEVRGYGTWPSPHPLFSFPSLQVAKENLGLLARILFHPWMKIVIEETIEDDTDESPNSASTTTTNVAATKNKDKESEDAKPDPPQSDTSPSEAGPDAAAAENEADESPDPDNLVAALLAEWVLILMGPTDAPASESSESPSSPSAREIRQVLIEQFALAAGRERGKKILTYWQNLGKAYLILIPTLPATHEGRKHLTWRRNRMDGLITDFRRALSPAPPENKTTTPIKG